MRRSEPPVVVETVLDAGPEKVWTAITDPAQMRQWFFPNIPDFRPEVGFETTFDVVSGERVFPHQWRILAVETGSRIQYDWRYHGYAGAATVEFEVIPQDSATTLRVTSTALEDFPDDIPEFQRESCVAGWDYLIGESLRQFLASQTD